jgi:hypothetical protein
VVGRKGQLRAAGALGQEAGNVWMGVANQGVGGDQFQPEPTSRASLSGSIGLS